FFFFFFQAEDGIRDLYVTGVQTCALPISLAPHVRGGRRAPHRAPRSPGYARHRRDRQPRRRNGGGVYQGGRRGLRRQAPPRAREIGRASCRERVWSTVMGAS